MPPLAKGQFPLQVAGFDALYGLEILSLGEEEATARVTVSDDVKQPAGLVRRAQAQGDFAAILRKGDPERGALLLVVSSRGQHVACLERTLGLGGKYAWRRIGPADSAESEEVAEFLAKRARFDTDSWAIELDIADPERFIAETTAIG